MKVLLIHCTYQYRGGEDNVVDAELALLREHGVTAETLMFTNHGGSLSKILQLPFNIKAYQETKRKIAEFNPDVIHIHNLHYAASPSVIMAASRSKVPMVMTLHNFRLLCPSATLMYDGKLFTDSVKKEFPWSAVKKGVYRNSKLLTFWLAASGYFHRKIKTYNKINKFLFLTEFSKSLFQKSTFVLEEEKTVVKPNFTAFPSIEKAERGEHFLYIGRLTEEKGVRLLLEAFSQLPYKLVIAGDGELKAEVEQAAREHPQIEYRGILNSNEVQEAMAQSSALVFPSMWYEGMPLTILEAFSTATPVIGSNIGSISYIIEHEHNGLVFEPGNLQSLKDVIAEWHYKNPEVKEKFSEHAYSTYLSKYTPNENFRLLEMIYSGIVNPGKENHSMVETALAMTE